MKTETKLARVFSTLAQEERKTESTAAEIFAVIKEGKVRDIEKWDELVEQAYTANGWNARPGRPAADAAPKDEVPATVRTYVTIVRQALRARLRITTYATFTALRADLARKTGNGGDHRGRAANDPHMPKAVAQNFVGVSLHDAREPNGALFHDLGAVYITLPAEQRDLFGRQLNKLLHRYLPLAKLPKRLPAPKEEGERKGIYILDSHGN